MIEGLNEASNELGELAAGSEEAEERYVSPLLTLHHNELMNSSLNNHLHHNQQVF